jgi:hypothetical protein
MRSQGYGFRDIAAALPKQGATPSPVFEGGAGRQSIMLAPKVLAF